MFHFDFTITLGQVAIIISILTVGWGIMRRLTVYGVEHEMLMQKYAEGLGVNLNDLPTRSRRDRRY